MMKQKTDTSPKSSMSTIQIDGRECLVHKAEKSEHLLLQPVFDHDQEMLDAEVAAISSLTGKPFTLAAFEVKDWQGELTPWAAPAVFGTMPFGDGAAETLSFVKDVLLSELQGQQFYDAETMKCFLGGYSLAGLFALWAGCQTTFFQGLAAVSPSVWYPDWMDYVESHRSLASFVYLSLGDKEEKTRNPLMARVGECIRRQHELLAAQGLDTILEWNKGNHFQHAEERTAKGFAWLINHIC